MRTRSPLLAASLLLVLALAGQAVAQSDTPTVTRLFAGDDPVVLEIDGQPVLLSELAAPLRIAALRTLFDLDGRLADEIAVRTELMLYDAEAAAAGMETGAWLQAQTDAHVAPVTRAEVRQVFRQEDHPRGTRFADVEGVIEARLNEQRQAAFVRELLAEIQARHGVKVHHVPFRLEVSADDDPVLGAPQAPVTIVQFSDFQCPYCARAHETVQQVLALYPGQVRLVARDFPLPMHPEAMRMAEAAQCAAEQGDYWPFAAALFDEPRGVHQPRYDELAAGLGLDGPALQACVDSARYEAEVQADVDDAVALGVAGTPAFFVNGRMISGAQPAEVFIQLIEDELRRLRP